MIDDFWAAFQLAPFVALTFVAVALAALLWEAFAPRASATHLFVLWISGSVFFVTLATSRAVTSETSHWGVWVAAAVLWTWYVAVVTVSLWTWRRWRGRKRT